MNYFAVKTVKKPEEEFLRAVQIVAPVIANPQGEAIHTGTLDCFTLRDDGSGRRAGCINRHFSFPRC
jgi:hypothetical protein